MRFVIEKTKLYDRLRGRLNARQQKVLERMFREGPDGFKGGLSAENYTAIAKCSRATTTRDLSELVAMGALVKTGQLKGTRYRLAAGKQEMNRKQRIQIPDAPQCGGTERQPSPHRRIQRDSLLRFLSFLL